MVPARGGIRKTQVKPLPWNSGLMTTDDLCGYPYIRRQMLQVHPLSPTGTRAASQASFVAAVWEETTQWDRGNLLVSQKEALRTGKIFCCYILPKHKLEASDTEWILNFKITSRCSILLLLLLLPRLDTHTNTILSSGIPGQTVHHLSVYSWSWEPRRCNPGVLRNTGRCVRNKDI